MQVAITGRGARWVLQNTHLVVSRWQQVDDQTRVIVYDVLDGESLAVVANPANADELHKWIAEKELRLIEDARLARARSRVPSPVNDDESPAGDGNAPLNVAVPEEV